jgi:hypothetical protein
MARILFFIFALHIITAALGDLGQFWPHLVRHAVWVRMALLVFLDGRHFGYWVDVLWENDFGFESSETSDEFWRMQY